MDGWCLDDFSEFLGCSGFACDYAGPACNDENQDMKVEIVGCLDGWSPCEVSPITTGCGG